jgi:hypothetical protein
MVRAQGTSFASKQSDRNLLVLKSDDASFRSSLPQVTGNYSAKIFDAVNFHLPDGTNLVTMQSILGRLHW